MSGDTLARNSGRNASVVGYVTGNLGLGVAARDLIALLLDRGCHVKAFDLDPGFGRKDHDSEFRSCLVESADELPPGLTFWVMATPSLGPQVLALPELYFRSDCFHVAEPFWELPVLRKHDACSLGLFDAVLAASRFMQHTVDLVQSPPRSVYSPQFVRLPGRPEPDRARFGLPENAVTYLASFDPYSDLHRKNPLAVLEAFMRGVGTADRAWLILKTNGRAETETSSLMPELVRQAKAHPRVRLVTDSLSYRDTMRLYASCDIYVSLHRSEGLGLTLIECMSMGKPVIATAWSGNMSFMHERNACLVSCELVPVTHASGNYGPKAMHLQAVWAEPSIDEASRWMKALYDSADLRQRIGEEGRCSISTYVREAREAKFLERLDAIWQQRSLLARSTIEQSRRDALRAYDRERRQPEGNAVERLAGHVENWAEQNVLWRFNRFNKRQASKIM